MTETRNAHRRLPGVLALVGLLLTVATSHSAGSLTVTTNDDFSSIVINGVISGNYHSDTPTTLGLNLSLIDFFSEAGESSLVPTEGIVSVEYFISEEGGSFVPESRIQGTDLTFEGYVPLNFPPYDFENIATFDHLTFDFRLYFEASGPASGESMAPT